MNGVPGGIDPWNLVSGELDRIQNQGNTDNNVAIERLKPIGELDPPRP